MRQIITLEKEIAFKTMVGDITSISLEEDLNFINDSEIEGNLIIAGTYKMTEASTLEEDFSYKIPVEIMLTTALLENKRKIDINNFTYQVINEDSLEIKVELLIEGLEKIEIEDIKEEKEEVREMNDEKEIEILETTTDNDNLLSFEEVQPQEKEKMEINEVVTTSNTTNNDNNGKEVMNSIFSAFANTDETYATYSIYILREDDNIEEIISKYKTTRDVLSEYNDLNNLKIGSKLIIPTVIEEINE